MKPRGQEAARLESDYLGRVRAALTGRDGSQIEEILDSLREHIEEELSGNPGAEVGLVQMANVLEELGPPEAYAGGEARERPEPAPSGKRLSRLALASALCWPGAILAGVLGWAVFPKASADVVSIACVGATGITGMVLGIAAMRAIRNEPEKLSGKGLAWTGAIFLPALFLLCVLAAVMYLSPGRMSSKPRVEHWK